jgi:LmbE family N-acetylglucosaminyl deacetylase
MTGRPNPFLAPEPAVLGPGDWPAGGGRTILLVVAHADDPAFFLGGVIPHWVAAGWRVVCLRVTDDRWDSWGLAEAETAARNAAELRAAAAVLGIAAVEDLGWHTDRLGDASRVALRESVIRAIRRHRPHGVATHDPDSLLAEDNLDHRVLGRAVDEACWCAMFDKHHPEHAEAGLGPHGVVERWFFGRTPPAITHVADTAATLGLQIEAILHHRTPLANIAHQMTLLARTAAGRAPLAEAALSGDPRPLVEALLTDTAARRGAPFGLRAAEWLRLYRAVWA